MALKRLMDNPSSQRKINSPSSSSRGTQRKKMKRNGVKQISNGILVSVLSNRDTKVLFIIQRSKSNPFCLLVPYQTNHLMTIEERHPKSAKNAGEINDSKSPWQVPIEIFLRGNGLTWHVIHYESWNRLFSWNEVESGCATSSIPIQVIEHISQIDVESLWKLAVRVLLTTSSLPRQVKCSTSRK